MTEELVVTVGLLMGLFVPDAVELTVPLVVELMLGVSVGMLVNVTVGDHSPLVAWHGDW